jgi:hypothetical protein
MEIEFMLDQNHVYEMLQRKGRLIFQIVPFRNSRGEFVVESRAEERRESELE